MTHVIYWAEPIDFAENGPTSDPKIYGVARMVEEALRKRGRAAQWSSAGGWSIYRPAAAWSVADGNPTYDVQRINMQVLAMADAVVAVLPHGVRTVGVPFELGYAEARDKRWRVVMSGRSWALPHGVVGSNGGVWSLDSVSTETVVEELPRSLDDAIEWEEL